MYYDDDENGRTVICYAGHPLHFVESHNLPSGSIREPTIDELLKRKEAIWKTVTEPALRQAWKSVDARAHHSLWSENSIIEDALYERRVLGEMEHLPGHKTIFLCHSSVDKGFVRMVNDDLRRLGARTWLDENNIKVGDSLVGKVSEGLKTSQYMAVFLSPDSVKSLWTKREWQSFLSRQLAGSTITILPILIEKCEVPAILADLKYADFTESYEAGLKDLHKALV